jgi:hypothetical protein
MPIGIARETAPLLGEGNVAFSTKMEEQTGLTFNGSRVYVCDAARVSERCRKVKISYSLQAEGEISEMVPQCGEPLHLIDSHRWSQPLARRASDPAPICLGSGNDLVCKEPVNEIVRPAVGRSCEQPDPRADDTISGLARVYPERPGLLDRETVLRLVVLNELFHESEDPVQLTTELYSHLMLRRRTHHCVVAQHILRARDCDRKASRVGAAL